MKETDTRITKEQLRQYQVLKAMLGEKAGTHLCGMNKKLPIGYKRTNKIPRPLQVINAYGVLIGDPASDGSLIVAVVPGKNKEQYVSKTIDRLCGNIKEQPQFVHAAVDTKAIDEHYAILLGLTGYVKRIRRGPVQQGAKYPNGVRVLACNNSTLNVVVTDGNVCQAAFIQTAKDSAQELAGLYRN